MDEKQELLEEEALIIRTSGEIPEVAYHGSLYFLCKDFEGPRLRLSKEEKLYLKKQVRSRYREIILRDLDPANRDSRIYRGMARAIVNWQRMSDFCRKEGLSVDADRMEIVAALKVFMEGECADVASGRRTSCVNCSSAALRGFASMLRLDADSFFPDGWRLLCRTC